MKKLNILGLKVSIKIKKPNDSSANAEWHPDLNQIWIDPDSNEKSLLLFHEVFHTIWSRSGVYQARLSEEIEEVLAECLANVLNENMVTLWQIHNKFNQKPRKK